MNSVKKIKTAYVAYSIFLILLGLVFFIKPDISATTICYMVGVIILVCGITKLLGYFVNDAYGLAFQYDFALGIVTILVAIALFTHPRSVLSLIDMLLGLFILIDGAFKLQTAVEAKKFGLNRWWLILATAFLTVIAGMLLVINPFEGAITMMRVVGIAFAIDGVQNLIVALHTVKMIKRFSPILTEYEEVEMR